MSKRRGSLRLLLLAAVACLLTAVVVPVARASPEAATLSLSTGIGPPTTRVSIDGTGFGPVEAVRITFDGRPVGKARTDGAGGFTAPLRIPRTARPGVHRITARGRDSGLQASATFTVRTDWPMFRYSPERTGYNPYENSLSTANVAALVPTWIAPASELTNIDPAVVGGVVYTGDAAGHAFALDAATGEERWEVALGGLGVTDPAVAEGVVYIGNTLGGTVFALDASTGGIIWERPLGGAVFESPAVADGMVYVSSNAQILFALDAATGDVRWQAAAIAESAPAVVDGTIYVGGASDAGTKNLFAFDARTGAELWTADLADVAYATPPVVDGVLSIAVGDISPSQAYAIDAATGTILWSSPVSGDVTSSPAVANGLVYVNTFEGEALEAFDAATGELEWTAPVGGCSSSPAVANGVLYVGSDDFSVYALNALTGEVLWSYPTGGKACSGPAVVDGMVYMGSFDRNFYAFGLP